MNTNVQQGDWLIPHNCDEPHQIKDISYQEEPAGRWPTITFEGKGFWGVWYYQQDCKPVPITKEILESNGFKVREGCTTAWDWHSGETSVHISGDHTCPIGQTLTIYVSGGTVGAAFSSHRVISDLKIRGIHELQHALRLCNINKKIEIKIEGKQ
jgi:hypothetical protein